MTRRRSPARAPQFRALFEDLRRQLGTGSARTVLGQALGRCEVLSRYDSVEALLARMADERAHSWTEREALTRVFIAEHQRRVDGGFWASLLLVTYFPMLSHLRFRLHSDAHERQELDSIVIASFLEVVATLDLNLVQDRTAMQLRQRTQRRVFELLGRTSAECRRLVPLTSANSADLVVQVPAASTPRREPDQTVAKLLDVAGAQLPPEQLDIVVATVLQKERLRSYAGRYTAAGESPERVYQRLKRRRTRAMDRLRGLISRSRVVAPTKATEPLAEA